MDMTPATQRARFAELSGTRTAILAISTPLRDERDAVSAAAQATIATIDIQIAAEEAGLYEIDQERAMIARALGGRTGTAEAG